MRWLMEHGDGGLRRTIDPSRKWGCKEGRHIETGTAGKESNHIRWDDQRSKSAPTIS
jgi:hypothetical protein